MKHGRSGLGKSIARKEWKTAASLWDEYIAPTKGWVVDMGAGNGGFWEFVTPPDMLLLLDISASYGKIDSSGRRVTGDAVHPPLKDGSLDCIVSLGLIEYFKELEPVLLKWRSLVRPGGKILFSNSPPIVPNLARSLVGRDVHPRSDNSIRELLRRTGWDVYPDMPHRGGWQSLFCAHTLPEPVTAEI